MERLWRLHSVQTTRSYYRLPNYRNSDEWLTIEQTSRELKVSHTVIRRLIRDGTLPATQIVESTPWIVNRESLSLPAVQSEAQAVRDGRQLLRSDPNQTEFPLK